MFAYNIECFTYEITAQPIIIFMALVLNHESFALHPTRNYHWQVRSCKLSSLFATLAQAHHSVPFHSRQVAPIVALSAYVVSVEPYK